MKVNSSSSPETRGEVQQYLTFVLGGDAFAIGILAIKEIIAYTAPTAVPMTPPHVRGVIDVRGAAVPVLDLSVRFGNEAAPVTKRSCIVILEITSADAQNMIGIVVDAVNAVLDIPPAEIEPPPALTGHISSDFIQGLGKVNGRFVILLDIERILASEAALLDRGRRAMGSEAIPTQQDG
jgi:purine-binding chemotaxis protein CheW